MNFLIFLRTELLRFRYVANREYLHKTNFLFNLIRMFCFLVTFEFPLKLSADIWEDSFENNLEAYFN